MTARAVSVAHCAIFLHLTHHDAHVLASAPEPDCPLLGQGFGRRAVSRCLSSNRAAQSIARGSPYRRGRALLHCAAMQHHSEQRRA